jgi:hypothetical protein
MTQQEMIAKWLNSNNPKVDNTEPLNRDTISIDFNGNIKRKLTNRKLNLLKRELHGTASNNNR